MSELCSIKPASIVLMSRVLSTPSRILQKAFFINCLHTVYHLQQLVSAVTDIFQPVKIELVYGLNILIA